MHTLPALRSWMLTFVSMTSEMQLPCPKGIDPDPFPHPVRPELVEGLAFFFYRLVVVKI
jgi:hypothetical protein